MEYIVLAMPFLMAASLGCLAICMAYFELWLLIFYAGLAILPIPTFLSLIGYPLVSSFWLWSASVIWWGHLTGGLFAIYWFGEYLGLPPRRGP